MLAFVLMASKAVGINHSQVVWDLQPPQQPTGNQRFWTPDAPIAGAALQVRLGKKVTNSLVGGIALH